MMKEHISEFNNKMGLNMTKLVFGVYNKGRLKPVSSATDTS